VLAPSAIRHFLANERDFFEDATPLGIFGPPSIVYCLENSKRLRNNDVFFPECAVRRQQLANEIGQGVLGGNEYDVIKGYQEGSYERITVVDPFPYFMRARPNPLRRMEPHIIVTDTKSVRRGNRNIVMLKECMSVCHSLSKQKWWRYQHLKDWICQKMPIELKDYQSIFPILNRF
jgi:hypothetical protein